MWDQLLTKLTELWNTLIDALQKGIEHAPLYLQDLFHRYVTYNIVVDSIIVFVWLSILIFSIYLHTKVKWWCEWTQDEISNRVWYHVAFGILSLAALMIWVIVPLERLIKYIFLPEIQLIQDIREFNNPKPSCLRR